ncbi:MAG TPA: radical SAM family heme chaperone HemW [Terracidiphilus sp.]|nr:radical SAM family heme chaperone HemW [Terracidiphilus sp.]
MKRANGDRLGVYLSFPFCRSKCTYCNFASGVYPAGEHARYVVRLVEEMHGAGAWAAERDVELPRKVDSIYFGGGTPSLLEPEHVRTLFRALRREFSVERDAEITVECAPGQLADATLEALAGAGVNRVSLGVQSFIDREARESGRLHTRAMVIEDLRRLRAAGIANLNVDLIAGLAGQTFDSWRESLDALLETDVPHASVYMLEVDEDSRLGREMLAGGARYHAELVPGDDAIAAMYETALERLAAAGLAQYEISNFAREGKESQHNLRYWQRRPYLGVGLDASSMLRSGGTEGYVLRATTTDDLNAYLEDAEPAETAWLSPERQHEEAWFLGLRLNRGVQVAALRREFGKEPVARALRVVEGLKERGLVDTDGRTVRLTAQGRLLSNEAFQEFLSAGAEEAESAEEAREQHAAMD